jgi:hypothetical protein
VQVLSASASFHVLTPHETLENPRHASESGRLLQHRSPEQLAEGIEVARRVAGIALARIVGRGDHVEDERTASTRQDREASRNVVEVDVGPLLEAALDGAVERISRTEAAE